MKIKVNRTIHRPLPKSSKQIRIHYFTILLFTISLYCYTDKVRTNRMRRGLGTYATVQKYKNKTLYKTLYMLHAHTIARAANKELKTKTLEKLTRPRDVTATVS